MDSVPDADRDADLEAGTQDAHAEVSATGRLGGLRQLLPVAAAVLVIDQLTKIWAVAALDDGREIDLFWTARFNLHRNEGAAFSVGTSITPVISVIAIAVSIALVYFGRQVTDKRQAATLGLVLGGAMGNVIDRALRAGDGLLGGAVIDFIDFQWWPIFNVADMAIVVGGFALVLLMSRTMPEPEPERDAGADA